MIPLHEGNGSGPLIHRRDEACNDCWGCVRYCPVRAIRVVEGRSEVIQEKCVACGICVNECGRFSHVVRDDTPAVVELLQSRRPVVALLATEFIAALYPMTVPQIERALGALGFAAVETTLLGEEIVAVAYERTFGADDSLLTMRSTCPVVVSFVRKYFPALTGALAPVVPPYIAQARLIRALYPPETAIVYVSPCYARKDEIRQAEFDGTVDAAVDFIELKRLITAAEALPARGRAAMPSPQRPELLKEVSLTDGFPRAAIASRDMTDSDVAVVRGLKDLDTLLRAISAGEAGPTIIDMLNCEGCIDGPAVNPGVSVHAKRTIDTAARHTPGMTRVSTRAILGVLPAVETSRSFVPQPVQIAEPTETEIDRSLRDGGLTRDTVIDCGACGWGTCLAHAAAVIRGDSAWDMCFPLQRSRLHECDAKLSDVDTIDQATGLWNRRAFSDRLDLELARHVRYDSALSIALIDVDELDSLAVSLGPDIADAVLGQIGERVSKSLRSTDFAARWSGDRLAVVLPGVGKTAAFAAADKLRREVEDASFTVTGDGYRHQVRVTLSAGVASAAPLTSDMMRLLEAAETALHDAVATGRNQVRLAPG